MIKVILLLLATLLLASESPQPKMIPGADTAALKVLVHQDPEDLVPEMAVIVGNIYQQGMDELNIKKNPLKAKEYFKWAVKNKVPMGSFLLGNLCLEQGDQKCFVEQMEIVVKAKDQKLSVPAAFQLTLFWNNVNRIDRSFEVMNYVADVYSDDRAQFMVGYSIVSGEYTPKGWSKRDGEFYLYQACTNTHQHDEVKGKCSEMMKKRNKRG